MTASPAHSMSVTTGSLYKASDYQMADVAPSPFQHYWSLGVEEQFYLLWPAVIIGTAWPIRRARRGLRGTCQVVCKSIPGGACTDRRRVVCRVVRVHSRSALCRVLFATHPRLGALAVGGLVALTATQWRRLPRIPAAIAGWVGAALILLACIAVGITTPYPGSAALLPVSRYRAGDRRGVCRTLSGMRSPLGIAADASGRAGFLFVVSLALAGAAARRAIAWTTRPGFGRRAGSGFRLFLY